MRRGRELNSSAARRFAAVAPDNHCAESPALSGLLSSTSLAPKSRSIFSRFGITVSTFSVLRKVVPPTRAVAVQSPVRASGSVLSSNA